METNEFKANPQPFVIKGLLDKIKKIFEHMSI